MRELEISKLLSHFADKLIASTYCCAHCSKSCPFRCSLDASTAPIATGFASSTWCCTKTNPSSLELGERGSHIPAVLVPGLHLRLRQVQRVGNVASIGHRQIFLATKFALQVGELRVSERCSTSAWLSAGLQRVKSTLPVDLIIAMAIPEMLVCAHTDATQLRMVIVKFRVGWRVLFNVHIDILFRIFGASVWGFDFSFFIIMIRRDESYSTTLDQTKGTSFEHSSTARGKKKTAWDQNNENLLKKTKQQTFPHYLIISFQLKRNKRVACVIVSWFAIDFSRVRAFVHPFSGLVARVAFTR